MIAPADSAPKAPPPTRRSSRAIRLTPKKASGAAANPESSKTVRQRKRRKEQKEAPLRAEALRRFDQSQQWIRAKGNGSQLGTLFVANPDKLDRAAASSAWAREERER